jgi:serine/threonine-protein kinase mTOR
MAFQMAPDYENLTLLQKVEVFEYGLQHTTGQDLYRVLWLKSTDSEHWLERRATYTRSLAVNSMVGHILGLGDRHPSNVLLERITGKVVHIDFGDCFEVAMYREKFPEKVPFRLTRMLTHAMEVDSSLSLHLLTLMIWCHRSAGLREASDTHARSLCRSFVLIKNPSWQS